MNYSSRTKSAMAAAIVGNTFFGFSFLASKIALSVVEPFYLLSARFTIAFLILTALALLKIIRLNFKGKNLKPLLLLGLFQPIIYFIFENYGVQMTNSSISGIIISLVPIATFFIGSMFLKEHYVNKQLAWAILSVIGVCILSVNGSMAGSLNLLGIFYLFMAVLSAAIYTAISRKISDEFSPIERTYAMFFIGAIGFIAMGLFHTKGSLFSGLAVAMKHPAFVVPLLYLAIFSSIGAYFMLNYSLTYLPIRQSTSFTSLTSVISVVAGALILSEPISPVQFVGIVFIIVGVYMVNRLGT